MILSPAYFAHIEKRRDGTYTVVTPLPAVDASVTPTLLYLGAQSKTNALTGSLTLAGSQCTGVRLEVGSLDEHGQVTDLARIVHQAGDPAEFSVAIPQFAGATLLVKLLRLDESSASPDCSLTIDRFGLSGT
jgi:hypothetical protein